MEDNQLTTPKEENAFDVCKRILSHVPEHKRARQILKKVMERYKYWGDNAYRSWRGDDYQTEEREKAYLYYTRYQLVADYLLQALNAESITREYQDVQKRLKEMEFPSLAPEAQSRKLFEEFAWINQRLAEYQKQYQAFREMKKQGTDVYSRFLPVLRGIVKELKNAENEYLRLSQTPGMSEKIRLVRKKQKMIEQERFEILRQAFLQNYAIYRRFKQQEEQGADVTPQMIPVLKNIVAGLKEIETIDDWIFQESPENLKTMKNLNNMFQQDLLTRQNIYSFSEK